MLRRSAALAGCCSPCTPAPGQMSCCRLLAQCGAQQGYAHALPHLLPALSLTRPPQVPPAQPAVGPAARLLGLQRQLAADALLLPGQQPHRRWLCQLNECQLLPHVAGDHLPGPLEQHAAAVPLTCPPIPPTPTSHSVRPTQLHHVHVCIMHCPAALRTPAMPSALSYQPWPASCPAIQCRPPQGRCPTSGASRALSRHSGCWV